MWQEGVVSGLLSGIDGTKEVCHNRKDIIIRTPLLDDMGFPFDRIGPFQILFDLILFYPILDHNASLILLYYSHVDT